MKWEKKSDRCRKVVETMKQAREPREIPYRALCDWGGFVYPSVMRWKTRIEAGQEPVLPPGPKKVAPLDFEELRRQIEGLKHGRKRTEGVGELYGRHREEISRRELNALVAEERRRQTRERREEYRHVAWRVPRLVWAMDDTEHRPDESLPKAYLHTVQDLGSRLKFEPVVGWRLAHGEQVAAHLQELFETHGPPLFLKRDNGGNLNHGVVDKLLEAYLVIPMNSPAYYPQYNGGIEFAQREIKARLQDPMEPALLAALARLEVQALNLKPRPCLGMRSSWEVFRSGQDLAAQFTKRKRKEVYEEIKRNTLNLMERKEYIEVDAWRDAVQTWLLDNHFISVSLKHRVSPYSCNPGSHN
jgi:hypothetical protein